MAVVASNGQPTEIILTRSDFMQSLAFPSENPSCFIGSKMTSFAGELAHRHEQEVEIFPMKLREPPALIPIAAIVGYLFGRAVLRRWPGAEPNFGIQVP